MKILSKEELKQKNYYNSIAKKYDEHFSNPYALRYRYEVYDQLLGTIDLAGKKVLDAMCGGGEGTGYLLSRGAKVVGLDISEECCKIYKMRYPDAEIVCSSVLATDFSDDAFDLVLTDSLHHLHPYLEKGLAEINRIIKPGGSLCFWEPNADSMLNLARKFWYRADPSYFEENEAAISVEYFRNFFPNLFSVESCVYGGNIGYLLVNCSMAFRIPEKVVKYYAPVLLALERVFKYRAPRALSLWCLALVKKPN